MRVLFMVFLAALALAGCAAPAVGSPTGTPAATPVLASPMGQTAAPAPAVATAVAPTSAPTVTARPLPPVVLAPTAAPTAPALGATADVEQLARDALAAHLGIPAATLSLVSAEAREWNDGSLGCPAPDRAYTQVIVPGYLLVFGDGQRQYAIHTSERGSPLILCDAGTPVGIDPQ